HGRVDDRLQTRTAAPVDLLAGHGHGQSRVECGDSADARGLRGGVALTHDDVDDEFGVEPGPAHQLSDDGGGEFVGGDGPELSAEGSDRGPQRLASDDVLVHGSSTPRPPAAVSVLGAASGAATGWSAWLSASQ